jgi:hypothetical protein
MGGDGPLDLQHGVARAATERIRKALMHSDDGEVFAAAHIAMDIQEAGILSFEYEMFEFYAGEKSLEALIRGSVSSVAIAEEWGTDPDDGNVIAREQVRRELLIRLDSLKARHQAERGLADETRDARS